jgi:hypothetical protein
MAARKRTTRRSAGRSGSGGGMMSETLDDTLKQIEGRLPANLKPMVRQLRQLVRDLQKQIDRARAERDARWNRIETQIRKETVSILRRLEKAVQPSAVRKKTTRKAASRRKSGRKKAASAPPA